MARNVESQFLRPNSSLPKNIFTLFILLTVFLLLSCREKEETNKVSVDKHQEVTSQLPAITYAYLPEYPQPESFQRHHLLVEYLAEQTGLPVQQVFPDTFADHISMFGQGKIDISFSNPFLYVKLANRFGAKAMARIVAKDERAEIRGLIIARKDNRAIQSLDDCRGKSWLAVDPSSAGGYLFPLGHFVDHGLNLRDFKEVKFTGGSQEGVIRGVISGNHDFGTIRENSLKGIENKIDIEQIKVVAHTIWYPGWVYSYNPRLSKDVVDKIQVAMLKLDYQNNPQHRAVLDAARFIGIIPSTDEDFDRVRDLSKKVGLDLE